MPRSKPLVDANGEVREIKAADLQSFRPAGEALPASLRLKVGVRGAQKAPIKERITIRLSPEVVQRFRATGDGWQTRVDAALQDWLKTHKPAKVSR
ncbi:MAG: BrnA antitoxin family protein [Proteobacteria bacterium]|nr:BrnA antitoxin family protein [Pseudomonadota bacterium]